MYRCHHKPKFTPPRYWPFFGAILFPARCVCAHKQPTTLHNLKRDTHNVELDVLHARSLSNKERIMKKIWHAESNRPHEGLGWHISSCTKMQTIAVGCWLLLWLEASPLGWGPRLAAWQPASLLRLVLRRLEHTRRIEQTFRKIILHYITVRWLIRFPFLLVGIFCFPVFGCMLIMEVSPSSTL